MNTPSVSIFQGMDNIKVNSTLERAEEEEAEEDQRRRNEELGNLLLNAFDDLGDDESTMDSSRFSSEENLERNNNNQQQIYKPMAIQHQQQQQHNNKNALEQYGNEMHHIKMLLESRTHELENLKQLYVEDNKKIDELQKRLTLTQAELDRALSTKNSTYELLVESKEKCSNLENTIGKLRNEKKSLETENNTLIGKLETAQTMLSDVQRKYDMVERDLNKHNERNAEVRRKQMEDRHRAELEILRQQMEQVADKLDKKSNELDSMTARYHALQSTHEMMLVDKAEKINDLNNALSAAQNKCEQLLSRPDYFQENVRLQKLVASLQNQLETMEHTIATLNERLEQTTNELDVMDSVLQQHNLEDTPRRLSQTQGRVVGSTPLNTVDRMSNLRDELYRALANVKNKREEIRKLQKTLEEKNNEIRQLRDEENQALVQITTLKEENLRLQNRLRVLEAEYHNNKATSQHNNKNELEEQQQQVEAENFKDNDNAKIKILNEQLELLQQEKLSLTQEIEMLQSHLTERNVECKQLKAELENLKVDIDETKQEYVQMQNNLEKLVEENKKLNSSLQMFEHTKIELEKFKFLHERATNEIDRLKELYVQTVKSKETIEYEIEKVRKTDTLRELQMQRDKVSSLQRALELAEMKCSELAKSFESSKLSHEREINELRERYEKERLAQDLKTAKESSNNCTKCIDLMAEITKHEIQNLKLNKLTATQKQEIDELNEELKKTKSLITELSEKLKLSEHQEQLIKELKKKAQLFEDYMKTASTASEGSSMSPGTQKRQNGGGHSTPSSDKGVGTSPELERTARRNTEQRIREEMAKLFANEMKQLHERLQLAEEKNQCLQAEYKHLITELQQRQNDIDELKDAILAEREQLDNVLHEKDLSCQTLLQKYKVLLHRCRDEIKEKNDKINELSKELSERQTQIEAERKSMKAVMTQWEQQRKEIDDIEKEWRKKLKDNETLHATAIASWQTKYNSAKRTAANYKRYAEDKEAHMLREYDRIKGEYETNLNKIEMSMKEILERKNREIKEAKAAATAETQQNLQSDNNKENKAKN